MANLRLVSALTLCTCLGASPFLSFADGYLRLDNRRPDVPATFEIGPLTRAALMLLRPDGSRIPLHPQTNFRQAPLDRYLAPVNVHVPGVYPGDAVTVQIALFEGETEYGGSNEFEARAGSAEEPGILQNLVILSKPLTRFDGDPRPVLDPFFIPQNENFEISSLAWQPQVLVAGNFLATEATSRFGMFRLLGDGSIDPAFQYQLPDESTARIILVQPDSKILLAGTFPIDNGPTRYLLRLLSSGELDPSFSASSIMSEVTALALLNDGRIAAGLASRPVKLQLLASDGSADGSFVAPQFAFSPVSILQ